MRESLESLLEKRWSNYRKALNQCRKKFSSETVHALRVAIRRILSTLTLLGEALPGELIDPIQDALKARLKAFSSLRDTQVQLGFVEGMNDHSSELEAFQQFLQSKERRLVKRLAHDLEAARTGKLTRRLSRLRRAVEQTMDTAPHAGQIEAALLAATGRAFENVRARYRRLDAANMATIHGLRVAFKKFRYMVESLAQVRPGVTARQLRAMQACQTRMGEIQDVEVLLARVQKFGRKREVGPVALKPFQEELLRRRARLVGRFLASADQVLDFWPPPLRAAAGRAPRREKGNHGTPYSKTRHRR